MVISASQSRDSSTETTERRFALGVGLTNECNLACAFCYRDPTRLDRLSLAQVRALYADLAQQLLDGRLSAPVEKIYPIEEIKTALAHAQQGERTGKILVAPNGAI